MRAVSHSNQICQTPRDSAATNLCHRIWTLRYTRGQLGEITYASDLCSRGVTRLRRPLTFQWTVAGPRSSPLNRNSNHTAVMSAVKGGYDEVEFLYSKPPYVL